MSLRSESEFLQVKIRRQTHLKLKLSNPGSSLFSTGDFGYSLFGRKGGEPPPKQKLNVGSTPHGPRNEAMKLSDMRKNLEKLMN